MAKIEDLREGQGVSFRPSHNKALELQGEIVSVDREAGTVNIETWPDGRILERATVETAAAGDVFEVFLHPLPPASAGALAAIKAEVAAHVEQIDALEEDEKLQPGEEVLEHGRN